MESSMLFSIQRDYLQRFFHDLKSLSSPLHIPQIVLQSSSNRDSSLNIKLEISAQRSPTRRSLICPITFCVGNSDFLLKLSSELSWRIQHPRAWMVWKLTTCWWIWNHTHSFGGWRNGSLLRPMMKKVTLQLWMIYNIRWHFFLNRYSHKLEEEDNSFDGSWLFRLFFWIPDMCLTLIRYFNQCDEQSLVEPCWWIFFRIFHAGSI